MGTLHRDLLDSAGDRWCDADTKTGRDVVRCCYTKRLGAALLVFLPGCVLAAPDGNTSQRLATADSTASDSVDALVLVTGQVSVAVIDPGGRRNEWGSGGVVAQIPGCSQADVTESDVSGEAADPAMMFTFKRLVPGEYT